MFLYAEYLALYKKDNLVKAFVQDWKKDYNATEREILKAGLLKEDSAPTMPGIDAALKKLVVK